VAHGASFRINANGYPGTRPGFSGTKIDVTTKSGFVLNIRVPQVLVVFEIELGSKLLSSLIKNKTNSSLIDLTLHEAPRKAVESLNTKLIAAA
jgi:hypothetical protein